MSISSIQSHVAYGYVGNRIATFALQRLGHEVITVNTVQFSNHTGYGHWKGNIFSAEHIALVIEGLKELGVLDKCQAILSGYLGNTQIGYEIIKAVQYCRTINPQLTYLCDPVMGDIGRGLFVESSIPAFMQTVATTQAQIITPNHFEFELLTRKKVGSYVEVKNAIQELPYYKNQIILITSFQLQSNPKDELEVLMYYEGALYSIKTDFIHFKNTPNGMGDLFAALFLGIFMKNSSALQAFSHAVSSIYSILKSTYASQNREIAIIPNQDFIVKPNYAFEAKHVL